MGLSKTVPEAGFGLFNPGLAIAGLGLETGVVPAADKRVVTKINNKNT